MIDDSPAPVGVIGLGLLSTALAERLIAANFPTVVYNRTFETAQPLLDMKATWSENPLTTCKRVVCKRVVICRYTSDPVEEVLGHLAPGLCSGQILIDATIGQPRQAAALGGTLARLGVDYLESPIAASSDQTRLGTGPSTYASLA